MMIFWWLFGILFVVLIIGWLVPVNGNRRARDSAEDIVKRRYAGGEDREEGGAAECSGLKKLPCSRLLQGPV